MDTSFILGAFVVLVIAVLTLLNKKKSFSPAEISVNNAAENTSVVVEPDSKWWTRLNKANQLRLAVYLADVTLPVWEKYMLSDVASYRDTTTLLPTIIDKDLLATSLKEIKMISILAPGYDQKKINDCYNQFIGPVIALQDGDWLPPYAIKKIFLSCYNILKGIAENNKFNYDENFFVIAIDYSLDCIDITKLYSGEQVDQILLDYKLLV